MNSDEATAAVAALNGVEAQRYEAWPAPSGSVHDGLWYVAEVDHDEMPIDNQVWIVLPGAVVSRGVPLGNPINPPTPPADLHALS